MVSLSGVQVSDEVIHEFNKYFNRHRSNATFVIYQIENESSIVTEHISESKNFDDFLSQLPSTDCRYALYKTPFTTKDGRPSEKIVKISWNPSEASVRNKMIYASSSAALGSVLGGAVTTKINVKEVEQLSLEVLEEACRMYST